MTLGVCGFFLQKKDESIKILEIENSELIDEMNSGLNSIKAMSAELSRLQKSKSQLNSEIEELENKRNSLVSSVSNLENERNQADIFEPSAPSQQEIVVVQPKGEPNNSEEKRLIEEEIFLLDQKIKETKKKMTDQEKTWNNMSIKKSDADKQKFRNEVNAYLSGLLSKKMERQNKLREIQ